MQNCTKHAAFRGASARKELYLINRIRSLLFALGMVLAGVLGAQPVPTSVQPTPNGGWQLVRGGQPYYVNGAGGSVHMDQMVALGGNSLRTWGLEDAERILDEAQKHGLTVMMGLWLQHERHGFDYSNADRVASQKENFRQAVLRLKDHPALLCWGVGNEVDLFYTNTDVWYAVEDIAKMIHELDPNHPTTTVTAGLDSNEVYLIKTRCPNIDFYSVNTYADIDRLPGMLKKYGWDKAYMVTEWGPNGHWEVAKAPWGAPLEQSSAQKAESYGRRFAEKILSEPACMGSYVFLWGQKQETTSSWYGLFSERGEPTEALVAVGNGWRLANARAQAFADAAAPSPLDQRTKAGGGTTGGTFEARQERPQVSVESLDSLFYRAEAGAPRSVRVRGTWSENAQFWLELVPESTDIKAGGDVESKPATLLRKRVRLTADQPVVTFKAPQVPGAYRVVVVAQGPNGYVAYANAPLWINPRPPGARPRTWVDWETINRID